MEGKTVLWVGETRQQSSDKIYHRHGRNGNSPE